MPPGVILAAPSCSGSIARSPGGQFVVKRGSLCLAVNTIKPQVVVSGLRVDRQRRQGDCDCSRSAKWCTETGGDSDHCSERFATDVEVSVGGAWRHNHDGCHIVHLGGAALSGRRRSGTGAGHWSKFTDRLAVIGGADLTVLDRVKSAKPFFVSMGVLVVSCAALACISMTFALTGPLELPLGVALVLSLGWGVAVLFIQRHLLRSMEGVRGGRRMLARVVPRVLMAAVIGVVVAVPMVLRIFEAEILAQIEQDALVTQAKIQQDVEGTPEYEELQEVNAAIQELETAYSSPPELQAARDALKAAQEKRSSIQDQLHEVSQELACEEGSAAKPEQCEGPVSSQPGRGPRWQALNKRHRELENQLDVADERVRQAEERMRAAWKAADRAAEGVRTRICGHEGQVSCLGRLEARQRELEAQVAAYQKSAEDSFSPHGGLSGQLSALHRLMSLEASAATHAYAVLLLFVMIEILPVPLAARFASGSDHSYDEVAARMGPSRG